MDTKIHDTDLSIDSEDVPLKIIPFENLKITTCTCMWKLQGEVFIDKLFWILPITRVMIIMPKRNLKKIRIPFYNVPGSILSARYAGHTRGLIRSIRKTYFSHSITIDFPTSKKSVSIKLAPRLIHMCGASSNDDATEGAKLIMKHLRDVQATLDYISEHPQETKDALEWILHHVKGPEVRRPKVDTITTPFHQITVESEFLDNYVNRSFTLPGIPTTLDTKIIIFLVGQVDDFQFYSELKLKLEWSVTISRVFSPDLDIIDFRKVMVNYNFELGHRIDRYQFATMINGRNGIHSRYDNMANHNVTVEIPLENEVLLAEEIKRIQLITSNKATSKPSKSKKQITIMVYRTGKITYSGPNEDIMRKYYNIFMDEVAKIWPYIQAD